MTTGEIMFGGGLLAIALTQLEGHQLHVILTIVILGFIIGTVFPRLH